LGRGVKITTDNRGNSIKTPAADKTPVENVPAFSSYLSFWNKEYKDLKVSRPCDDICSHCFKFFYNKHKYSKTAFVVGVVDDTVLSTDKTDSTPTPVEVVSTDNDTTL
jgi:hypothetical protein